MHNEKFCLGYKQNTEIEMEHQPYSTSSNSKFIDNSYNENTNRINSTNDNLEPKLNSHESETIIKKLKDFKHKKSIEQSLKDMEDTLIRDTIRDKKLAISISNPSQLNTSINNTQPTYSMPNLPINTNTSLIENINVQLFPQKQYLISDPFKELLNEVSTFIFLFCFYFKNYFQIKFLVQ